MKNKKLIGGLLAATIFLGGYAFLSIGGAFAGMNKVGEAFVVDGSLETNEVDVASKLPGRLKLLVNEGDLVKAGQVVAELEAEELDAKNDQATAGVRGISAQVEQGKIAVELEDRKAEDQILQAKAGVAAARAAHGMALARLEALQRGARPQEIAQVEQGVAAAQAAFDAAGKTHQRIGGLAQDGVVAQQKADEVEMTYLSASAQLAGARAKLDLVKEGARREEIQAAREGVKQANAGIDAAQNALRLALDARMLVLIRQKDVDAARQKLAAGEGSLREVKAYQKQTRIVSPIEGRVTQVMSRSGEIVAPGYPVLSVTRTKGYWVHLFVDESKFAGHRLGDEVTVEIPALGRNLPGRLTCILLAADFATKRATNERGTFDVRSLETRVTLKEEPPGLAQGLTARVSFVSLAGAR
ncbi:MAG TPA: efflux RND transporter periplasmic adaptor subunit [Chroococcales cyanobacterium]